MNLGRGEGRRKSISQKQRYQKQEKRPQLKYYLRKKPCFNDLTIIARYAIVS